MIAVNRFRSPGRHIISIAAITDRWPSSCNSPQASLQPNLAIDETPSNRQDLRSLRHLAFGTLGLDHRLNSSSADLCLNSSSADLCLTSPSADLCLNSPSVDLCVNSPSADLCLNSPSVCHCLQWLEAATNTYV